jgi:hypothetical protein
VCNGDEIGLDFKLDWILVKMMEWNVLKISRNILKTREEVPLKTKNS